MEIREGKYTTYHKAALFVFQLVLVEFLEVVEALLKADVGELGRGHKPVVELGLHLLILGVRLVM